MASKKTAVQSTPKTKPAKKTPKKAATNTTATKTGAKKAAPKKATKSKAQKKKVPAVDERALLEESAADFSADALSTAKGLERATNVLEMALTIAEPAEKDEWLERALAPFYLDFVFDLAANQHALLQTAGTFLLKLQHPSTASRLLERLEVGILRHDADRYALYLVGLLGEPEQVPRLTEWFLGRPVKSIAHFGFPLYRLMCDALVRLQTAEVLEHIQNVIAQHDAGEIGLSKHHRYTYDTALSSIVEGVEHRWQAGPIKEPEA